MITIEIPNFYVPSQNTTDRTHWATKRRVNNMLAYRIRAAMSLDDVCQKGHFRYVEIMCYRPRLITDDANYRGGAKGLVDQLTKCGAISDDNDRMVSITYRQALLRDAPKKRALTIVRVSAEPIPESK